MRRCARKAGYGDFTSSLELEWTTSLCGLRLADLSVASGAKIPLEMSTFLRVASNFRAADVNRAN